MFEKTIFTVDSHTAGEPTRVIVGGLPHIPGKTMVEKLEYFRKNFDDVRDSLLLEPRGHKNMFGALVTAPVSSDGMFGVIFMNANIFPEMCGHGSIGVVTVLIETGMIKSKEPVTHVVFDTISGSVRAEAKISRRSVESVTIHNVPSFLYKSMRIRLPRIGELLVDISFGGKFFAIVSAKDLGIKVKPENSSQLVDAGLKVMNEVNSKTKVAHPKKPYIDNSTLSVLIYDNPKHSMAHAKNAVIARGGTIDRSPCGTGTCARMATLYAKGALELNEEFVNESIIGTLFRGKLIHQEKVGKYDAVVPEITGSAYVTGMCTFIIDPNDPLKRGFRLS